MRFILSLVLPLAHVAALVVVQQGRASCTCHLNDRAHHRCGTLTVVVNARCSLKIASMSPRFACRDKWRSTCTLVAKASIAPVLGGHGGVCVCVCVCVGCGSNGLLIQVHKRIVGFTK
eukprot:699741-Amphidinium_carterae.1